MARIRTGPTPVELALLGLLADGPAHPYALDQKLRREGATAEVAFSSIYAALNNVEKLGLVASRATAGARGKARRVYRLTPAGRSALRAAALEALAKPRPGPIANDLGVANLVLLGRDEALAAIAEARATIAEARRAGDDREADYPAAAVALHRSMILAAEERFYAELERLVRRQHPDSARRRGETPDAA